MTRFKFWHRIRGHTLFHVGRYRTAPIAGIARGYIERGVECTCGQWWTDA